MRPHRRHASVTVAALAAAVLAAGCSGSSAAPAGARPTPSAPAVVGAAATRTPAAALRARLTYLLVEHVELSGMATQAVVAAAGHVTTPAVRAALAALDANSVALGAAVASSLPSVEAPFLASWRQHVGYVVSYAVGRATKDDHLARQAVSDLDGYRTSVGLLLGSAVPELSAGAVADGLKAPFVGLLKAIDAQASGEPKQFGYLQDAAGQVPSIAETLAAGIAVHERLGRAGTPAADLLAGLTALLTQQLYATGTAVDQAVAKGLTDPMAVGATDALDAGSVALSELIGSAYPKAKDAFLASWRQRVGYFFDYALGTQARDSTRVRAAVSHLDGYRRLFGQLVDSFVPELPAAVVAEDLRPYVTSLLAAIDAEVAGDPNAVGKLATAAGHVAVIAAALAGAMSQDHRLS